MKRLTEQGVQIGAGIAGVVPCFLASDFLAHAGILVTGGERADEASTSLC